MQHIVIIGATSAMAEHCARLWVQAAPVRLTLVGRDPARTSRVADDLRVRSPQSNVQVMTTDFLNAEAIAHTVSAIVAQAPVDVVLIAHGVLSDQATCQDDVLACDATLQINGVSPVLFAEAFAKPMVAANCGTIAIIGTGIDRVYPSSNRKLAHVITGKGCIISEFPLGTAATASNFPRRNRLIAGLSQACLVVEAAPASGSLITARLAGELGRDIFAIPGSIHAPQYKGCHALIKQGAKLVECAQDILEELRPQGASPAEAAPESPVANPAHAPIIDALGHDPSTLDQLIARSGLTADVVLAMLTELSLEGVVTNLPGGRYQRLIRS